MNLYFPKCLLFDLDGTLLDSLPGIAFSIGEACRMCGFSAPEIDLRSLLGPPIRTILSQAVPTDNPAMLDKLERAFRSSYDTEGWRRTSCFEDAHAALGVVKAVGHRVFVVTNKPRRVSMQILEYLQLLQFFEQIFTRDSHSPPYPSKEAMLRAFLDQHGVLPSDCLMVGDTMEDAAAAAAVSIGFAYMTHGYGEVKKTSVFPVAHRFDNLLQLSQILTQEPVRDR